MIVDALGRILPATVALALCIMYRRSEDRRVEKEGTELWKDTFGAALRNFPKENYAALRQKFFPKWSGLSSSVIDLRRCVVKDLNRKPVANLPSGPPASPLESCKSFAVEAGVGRSPVGL